MAYISKIKTLNGTTYDLKVNSLDPSAITEGYLDKRVYLNTHPENGGVVIPFINNDIAFLTTRGGSGVAYTTTDTDYTAQNLAVAKSYSFADAWVDGSSSYGSFALTNKTDVFIVDLTLPNDMSYSTCFYIDFGAGAWRASDIKLYLWNSNTTNIEKTYRYIAGVTNKADGHWYASGSYTWYTDAEKTVVGGYGFNKMRFVLTNWNTTSARIAQIGCLNYGSQMQRVTTMSRGIDDAIWRSITPDKNNAYNLGSASKYWNNIYGTNIHGTLDGKASSADKLNTNAGSLVQPVFFENGIPKPISYTISKSVPYNAQFTDTTYQSLPAVVDGTDVSLVTTGEKYLWNSAASGGVSSVNGRTGAVVVVPVLSNTRPTEIYTGETWYKIV